MIDKIDLYDKLLKKYGDKQIIVAIEELSELQKELCKHLRGKIDITNLIEEIADTEQKLKNFIFLILQFLQQKMINSGCMIIL